MKKPIFFFFLLFMLISTFSACIPDGSAYLVNANQLEISVDKFVSDSGQTYDLIAGRCDALNIRTGGESLISVNKFPGYRAGDYIYYKADLNYRFNIDCYTSAKIDDVFKKPFLQTDYYKTVYDWYAHVQLVKNAYPGWEKDIVHKYSYYSFKTVNAILKNTYDYSGYFELNVKLNEDIITYNDEVISSVDFDIIRVRANTFTTGLVGSYTNIVNKSVLTPDTTVIPSKPSIDELNTISDKPLDDTLGTKVYKYINDHAGVFPQGDQKLTTQNYYNTPLSAYESLSLYNDKGNSATARVNLQIRPAIEKSFRTVTVKQSLVTVDYYTDFIDWASGMFGSPNTCTTSYEREQVMSLIVENSFVNQRYDLIASVVAKVPVEYFITENIDMSDPVVVAGDWVWDATILKGDMDLNIKTPPSFWDLLNMLNENPTISIAIIAIIAAVAVIYLLRRPLEYAAMKQVFDR